MIVHRLFAILARLGRETDGVAAVEFAIVMPLFVFGTLAMTDIGLRLMALQRADAEVRLAMEGAMRYADDVESLRSFVERNGGRTFSPMEKDELQRMEFSAQPQGVAIRPIDGCKASDGQVSFHASSPPCSAPSRWLEIIGARNITGILMDDQRLETLNHVRVR